MFKRKKKRLHMPPDYQFIYDVIEVGAKHPVLWGEFAKCRYDLYHKSVIVEQGYIYVPIDSIDPEANMFFQGYEIAMKDYKKNKERRDFPFKKGRRYILTDVYAVDPEVWGRTVAYYGKPEDESTAEKV